MKNNLWFGLTLSLVLAGTRSLAHEGHGIPGALPPGPHGGVVAESSEAGGHAHEQGHDHDHGGDKHLHTHPGEAKPHGRAASQKEYFFEAVYKDGKVKVYPLTFGANTSTFVSVPTKSLKNVTVKAEVPRRNTNEVLKTTMSADSIEAPFDSKKVNRFVVHVTAEIDGTARTSKLQIERNK